ncbi:MAG TPA: BTAD domain-containing putative transcriptional regulator [Casimicrobiaceae bacterium]|nr:BTAD domain-containing putative transcriptional regulator [Casimicrobiaceae bacterium]
MAVRSPALAKLTRPKLYNALPRPRLFSLLDEAATRPIVWVCAPPGAGKTTLVASYLETRDLRHVWYQADIGDADPATFIHYMRTAAAQVAGKTAAALPLFTPEPQQNLARFARAFFRDFFSVLPHPCVLVFDNFQEIRVQAEGRAAFAQGLEEIPEGITLIVVSRTDPPPEFARLVASLRIARIDPAALRCTPEEAEAILGSQQLDREHLERIQRQSDGWVAALVLLREHLSRRGASLDESLGEGKDAIFQYFAGEIFSSAKPENQRVLMLTAIPSSITQSEAIALTGSEDAPRLLDYLYRRHLFTDRRRGAQTSYHYHALFREFLLEEMRSRLPSAERQQASKRAAELLAERGQVSDALALFRDAGEWQAMHSLIRANALDWARQGRAQALSDWIEALPASVRDSDPWLEYWFGRAWIFVQPQRGRPALERAFAAFRAVDDLRGQALALSTIVTGYYYEWANFAPIDRWLPEFERLLTEGAAKLDRESELRAHAAWLIALLLRSPEDEKISRCAQRLDELIDGENDLNVRIMAASALFNYINWKTEGESAAALVGRIEPIVAKPEVTPLMQVWWRTHLSFWHYINGRYGESTVVMTDARAIAERYGLEAYMFEIDHAEASALINKGDHAAAKARLELMERGLSPARRMQWPYFHHVRSMLEQRLGQSAAATRDAERAVALARELSLPSLQLPHFLARLAQACAATGDWDGALRAADEAIALASPFERRTFEQRRELLQIEADLEAGETQRVSERLASVLAEYRAQGQFVFMRSRPDLAARLTNHALQHGIETEYVCALIERNGLVAPADAGPAWPFRLRVRVLAGFELVRDGQPVRFTGKAQQRPLDLLKLLVALGGVNVDAQQLTAALWPDADGAAAKTSFDSTLFRLRKLLDVENALVLAAGKLSLSRSLVWTDVWALEAALDTAQRSGESGQADGAATGAALRLLDAYPGPLLGADENLWIVKPRDALRARFVRTLMRVGEQLEARADWERAIDVYRRGLEADNLAESFYRGLMRALAATGDQAEALSAFRRCRELLSIVLGIKPSAETDRLYREIAAGAAR